MPLTGSATAGASTEPKEEVVLAAETLRNGTELTLHCRHLEAPSGAALVRYALSTKPKSAGSDTVLYLTLAPASGAEASIVWMIYWTPGFLYPKDQFAVKLLIHPDKPPLVIFVNSGAMHTAFSIYKIDLSNRMAPLPLTLDVEREEEWPQPSLPLSSTDYKIPNNEHNIAFVRQVNATFEGDSLKIQAVRELRECGPLVATFDFNATTWSLSEQPGTGCWIEPPGLPK